MHLDGVPCPPQAQLAAIFEKIARRNGFGIAADCGASALEEVLAGHFPESLRRRWNGGLPEGLFRRAQDALAKRLNVLTMSAAAATTLERQDVVAGARILAATLGDAKPSRGAPPPPPPPRPDDAYDEDDDVYGDGAAESGDASTSNPLRNILASLGAGNLELARLKDVPARLDRLERRLDAIRAPVAANPWAETPPPAPEDVV